MKLKDFCPLFKIAPHIAWNNVDGELALFDARDGAYHALNGSGAAIWRAVAAGLDLPQIAEALAAAYDSPRESIEENIREFLEAARAKGLLEETP